MSYLKFIQSGAKLRFLLIMVFNRTFQWGVDSVHLVKFNQVETNLLAAAASDNSIMLYDTRDVGPVRKVIMTLRSNALAWNPMEAMVFTTASEDYNLYSFDVRKLDRPVNVYMDHVGAVVDVDYSPTGRNDSTWVYIFLIPGCIFFFNPPPSPLFF